MRMLLLMLPVISLLNFHEARSLDKVCVGHAADVVLALDTSVSIWEDQFQSQLRFAQRLVSHFHVGEDAVRVGVLTFGTDVQSHVNLGDFDNADDIIDAVAKIPYRGGGTNTGAALKYAREVMFAEQNGGRHGVPRINIVITDGFSGNFDNTTMEASISRSYGINLMAVGVGHGVDKVKLGHIASTSSGHEKLVYTVDNFSELEDISALVTSATCQVIQSEQVDNTRDTEMQADAAAVKEYCDGKPTDVYFLVDSSSSIRTNNYLKMLHFITEVVDLFDQSLGITRVGLMAYSDAVHPFIPLDNTLSPSELKTTILNIRHLHGGTNTGSALQYLRKRGFAPEVARKNVAHVAIILTDGQSSDSYLTIEESRQLHEIGVSTFVIGIGQQVDAIELEQMGSEPKASSVFLMDDFHALSAIKETLATKACSIGFSGDTLQADEGYVRKCGLGDAETDIMYVYDDQSLSKSSNHIMSVISDTIVSTSSGYTAVKSGVINQASGTLKHLPLNIYKSNQAIAEQFTSSQDTNLPILVRELRTRSFQPGNGARKDSRKLAVFFIEGEILNYKQMKLETKRLKYGKLVEIVIVHQGKTPLPRAISALASHVITVSSFRHEDDLSLTIMEKLCAL